MDKYGEKKERRRKEKVGFPTGGGESTNPENMDALHASLRSLGTEEEDDITFPTWKGVYAYWYPVEPN